MNCSQKSLSFVVGALSSLLSKALKIKMETKNTSSFTRLLDMLSHPKGRTQMKGVWEQSSEEDKRKL
jgi:hypothetical protein